MKLHRIIPIILVGIALVLGGCGGTKGKGAAEAAVAEFHDQLDKGDFAGIYAAANSDFKAASTEKDFTALLEAVHRKLGKLESTTQAGWRINSFNLKTNVVLTYKTKFAEGEATESFNYRIDGEKALLLGYNVNSQALITK